MHIRYNGVDLEVTRLVNLERIPVYSEDKTTYLFTRVTVHCLALINEGQPPGLPHAQLATSYKLSDAVAGVGAPCERNSSHAQASIVETNHAILQALQQPRRRLVISFDSKRFPDRIFGIQPPAPPEEILLECPKPGEEVDSHNGPLPQLFNVNRAIGNRTMIVEWACVCFVRECDPCGDEKYTVPDKNSKKITKKVLISNRYAMSHTIDGNFATVRVVQGQAIFDPAAMKKAGITTPDWLRSELMLPVPRGFKREHVEVELEADGVTVNYTALDVEKMISYDDNRIDAATGKPVPRFVTHVEATHEQVYSSDPELVSAGLESVGHVANIGFARQAIFGLSDEERQVRGLPPRKKTRIGRVGSSLFNVTSLVDIVQQGLARVMPSYQEVVDVELWGSRYAKKADLIFLAYAIACGRLVAVPLGDAEFGFDPNQLVQGLVQGALRLLVPSQIRLSTSMFDKHVSLSMSIRMNGITTVPIIGGIAAPLKRKAVKSLAVPYSETIAGGNLDLFKEQTGRDLPDFGQTIGSPIPDEEPAPPHDDHTRGTYIERLFSQALGATMCEPVPDTKAPPAFERPAAEIPRP